ncbi:MAG TPA: 2-oxoglutarate dehydrogenase E1 component [Candidatus Latescibacteria bacterium]|nr:2-oxoglutarate dehydrogenase E1 component [Candidatus Latescibacterota bacterium]
MRPSDLNSANSDYIDALYEQYLADPASVDSEWTTFFRGFDFGFRRSEEEEEAVEGTSAATPESVRVAPPTPIQDLPPAPIQAPPPEPSEPVESGGPDRRKRERTDKGVVALVRAYRQRGHFIAQLDPLGNNTTSHPLLELSEFGITDEDLEKGVGFGTFQYKTDGSLVALLDALRRTYCGTLGMDTMTTVDKEQEAWLEAKVEPILGRLTYSVEERRRILFQLIEAEEFEQFLHTRYIGQKRFSIEGGDALLPLLDALVETGSGLGVEELVIGMAHRGRLNVLAHILHKPYEVMLADFEGASREEGAEDEGDVKYHQGYSYDFVTRQGRKMHLSLSPNPSHLELVNPIIEGMVLAKQDYLHDKERGRVIPLQIHGDAAFTGQGTVAETLNLSQLDGYWNGGTIHIIIDNQLGYTALPRESRFTQYPTDIARQIQAPVFHVNADDPEQVVHAARLAIEFRQEFKRDVLIDLKCYRRYGHNEADDPTLTQPLMYADIKDHPTAATLYGQQLVSAGVVSQEDVDGMRGDVQEVLDRCQEKAKRLKVKPRTNTFGGVWQGMTWAGQEWDADTAVTLRTLKRLGELVTKAPDGFHLHRTVERLNQARREMATGDRPIDWGCAEMLAYGSLLLERVPVRLVGQDAQRGTFAHRHAVWHDVETGERHSPLTDMARDQGEFVVLNTMLSELAVLGFEYGITSTDPRRLVMWEAQFGDFANGAQLVIDQYIASAEAKWHRMCGIVMLLPHGQEGMGPEHSSARLERYLQLCAKRNMQVVYPTKPSQIFHVLRRQMHRNFRKPLIVMTPKSLLRHKACVSDLSEFTDGGFQNVIDAEVADVEAVRRVILCTGKIYYDLLAGLEEKSLGEVAIVRVEQLYPFPEVELAKVMSGYSNADEYLWVQEEALNMGAWYFVQPLLDDLLPLEAGLRYVGRDEAASPAVGDAVQHQNEQLEIVEQALDIASDKQLKLEDAKSRVAGADGGSGS